MVRSIFYVVFLLPVVVSVIFGFAVMAQVLGEEGRELDMLPFLDPSNGGKHDVPHDAHVDVGAGVEWPSA